MVDTAEDRSTIGHIHCQHSCELKPQESGEQEMEQEMAVFSETWLREGKDPNNSHIVL